MVHARTRSAERRRDPRFALIGSVRLSTREPLALLEAGLVDVSAGGLRVTLPVPLAEGVPPLEVGLAVDVEVTVRDASDSGRTPAIHLRGRGSVVRRQPIQPQGAHGARAEVAVQLEGPLGFREYFGAVRVF